MNMNCKYWDADGVNTDIRIAIRVDGKVDNYKDMRDLYVNFTQAMEKWFMENVEGDFHCCIEGFGGKHK